MDLSESDLRELYLIALRGYNGQPKRMRSSSQERILGDLRTMLDGRGDVQVSLPLDQAKALWIAAMAGTSQYPDQIRVIEEGITRLAAAVTEHEMRERNRDQAKEQGNGAGAG